MTAATLLDAPLASTEFLALDTETNGLAGERCELTEVGVVLVGGGELHDRWSSLVGVRAPLSRGIQRLTGISQAMADAAPPPEAVLPELAHRLHNRALVAHSARFDQGVLRQAPPRAGRPAAARPPRAPPRAGPAWAAAGRALPPVRTAPAPPRPRRAGRRA